MSFGMRGVQVYHLEMVVQRIEDCLTRHSCWERRYRREYCLGHRAMLCDGCATRILKDGMHFLLQKLARDLT